MKDWEAVVHACAALHGVEQGTAYGKPALKFRGKTLASTTAPDPNSFVLHVSIEDKEVLTETDPDTFGKLTITAAGPPSSFATAVPARTG